VSLYLSQKCISSDDVTKIEVELEKLTIQIDDQQRIFVNGADVTGEIRSPKVDEVVSFYSSLPVVRHRLLSLQRKLGDRQNLIAEGRDMGTVVFPNADLKIFLKANARTRAARRWKELAERGVEISYDDVYYQIIQRDELDSKRKLSPLLPAEDAIILDTSDLTLEEVVEAVKNLIKECVLKVKERDC
jgi:cytidylate kinase